jgi:hypothetical protein
MTTITTLVVLFFVARWAYCDSKKNEEVIPIESSPWIRIPKEF